MAIELLDLDDNVLRTVIDILKFQSSVRCLDAVRASCRRLRRLVNLCVTTLSLHTADARYLGELHSAHRGFGNLHAITLQHSRIKHNGSQAGSHSRAQSYSTSGKAIGQVEAVSTLLKCLGSQKVHIQHLIFTSKLFVNLEFFLNACNRLPHLQSLELRGPVRCDLFPLRSPWQFLPTTLTSLKLLIYGDVTADVQMLCQITGLTALKSITFPSSPSNLSTDGAAVSTLSHDETMLHPLPASLINSLQHFQGARIATSRDLDVLAELTALVTLDLHLSSEWLTQLSCLERLETALSSSLLRLTQLQDLCVHGFTGDVYSKPWLGALTQLTRLELHGEHNVCQVGLHTLASTMQELTNLCHLDLTHCVEDSDMDISIMEHLLGGQNLTELRLLTYHGRVADMACTWFGSCSKQNAPAQLRILSLGVVHSELLSCFAGLQHIAQLRQLRLDLQLENDASDVTALTTLSQLTRLDVLMYTRKALPDQVEQFIRGCYGFQTGTRAALNLAAKC